MASEVQNQQPQPLEQDHLGGERGTNGGLEPHRHGLVAGESLRRAIPFTVDLFHTSNHPSSPIGLEKPCPLSLGRLQKSLNLQTGEIFYTISVQKRYLEDTKMSRRSGPKLDLKLNLSPPRANPRVESPSRSATVSPTSASSSCVSSELNQDETLCYSNSPEATSMMLAGCPRCLMYVMLAEEDLRCPKCKSTVLLDIVHENTTIAAASTITKARKS